MSDYISRQAAIDALENMSANYGAIGRREWHPHVNECMNEIRCLPSAQPERKKGYWKAGVWWKCSECGMDVSALYNYCPYCGADMRGEQNE